MIRSMSNSHQNKLKSQMSDLVLVTKGSAGVPEDGSSDVEEEGADEQSPLLGNGNGGTRSSSNRQDTELTTNHSLVPDASLPPQVRDVLVWVMVDPQQMHEPS